MAGKPQRIRDPLHDIIAFSDHEFERTMWEVIQTRPFQRLRRIRQLGFSEFTFPGATHTRFAHSLGVFHTARQLMEIIKQKVPTGDASDSKERTALAAALVHDVGHGMFSHAFEGVAEELNLDMADHEKVSEYLIRDSEIADVLSKGGEQPEKIATLIGRKGPADLYDAVVSSQFDADRLDYMRRDRLMSGVQSGGIDFTWLIKNLEIGEVSSSVGEFDESSAEAPNKVMTFVLGPKAIMAAEAYVLALFQLYPTLYFHKTTRAAEMVFKALMVRVFRLLVDGECQKTGLPNTHPFAKLAKEPKEISNVLNLDDTVFWGSMLLLEDAEDKEIAFLAGSLKERRLPKMSRMSDIGFQLQEHIKFNMDDATPEDREKFFTKCAFNIEQKLKTWCESNRSENYPRILFDSQERDPYSTSEKKGQLNRIHIMDSDGKVKDIREFSPMINALEPYRFIRAYTFDGDTKASEFVSKTVQEVVKEGKRNA